MKGTCLWFAWCLFTLLTWLEALRAAVKYSGMMVTCPGCQRRRRESEHSGQKRPMFVGIFVTSKQSGIHWFPKGVKAASWASLTFLGREACGLSAGIHDMFARIFVANRHEPMLLENG